MPPDSAGPPPPANTLSASPAETGRRTTSTSTVNPRKLAAEPSVYRGTFDPWNSVSAGHQRAENRLGGSTGWRDSRNAKLNSQFRAVGGTGGARMSDAVGEGSADYDRELGAIVRPEARARGMRSVADMLAKPGTMKMMPMVRDDGSGEQQGRGQGGGRGDEDGEHQEQMLMARRKAEDDRRDTERVAEREARADKKRIFEGVVVYVNGSTHPLISDHRLRHVLAERGGRVSMHLGRRQVTHVILGRTASTGGAMVGRAGGGLAAGKLQKEIARVGGKGIKYVGVEWVLESLRLGRRLPEARFGEGMVKTAMSGQGSIYGLSGGGRGSHGKPEKSDEEMTNEMDVDKQQRGDSTPPVDQQTTDDDSATEEATQDTPSTTMPYVAEEEPTVRTIASTRPITLGPDDEYDDLPPPSAQPR